MHTRSIYKFTVLMLVSAALAACSTPPSFGLSLSPTMNQQGSSPTPAASGSGDLCANSLVPVKPGAVWSYSNTGVAPNPVTFSTTITSVRADRFTVATHFDDSVTVEQDWQCTPDGLVAMSLGSAQTTLGLSMADITASILTTDVAGITLPANVQPGKTWMYAFKVTGNVIQNKATIGVNGNVSTTLQAVGMENVTVPAGTFDAMKIAAKTTFDMHATYSGIDVPISSSVDSNFWFAPGVGWIKSTQTGSLPGMYVNSTTELQSYKLP